MKIGTRVKYSDDAIRKDYDAMIRNAGGNRSRIRPESIKAHDAKKDLRGSITFVKMSDFDPTRPAWYRVEWDNGTTSETIAYLIAPAD